MDCKELLLVELESVVDRLTAVAGGERSESGSEAADHARRLGVVADRLAGVRLTELRTAVDSGVWAIDGSRSAKAWLSRTTGCSQARAGSDLKLSANLAETLPLTKQALLAGTCSLEQARALSTFAADTEVRRQVLTDPECGEKFLLSQTHLGAEAYVTFARTWAGRADPDAADAKRRSDRERYELFVSPTTGGGDIKGWGSPEMTELLRTTLRAEIGTISKDDQRTPGQRNHDALASLLQRIVASGKLGSSHNLRPTMVVHVPFETLVARAEGVGLTRDDLDHGRPGLGEVPAFLQGTREPLPPSVLRKLACDSEIMRVVFGPRSEVIDVGRIQRLFTGPLRRALEARDGGCRRPGCDKPTWMTIGHHVVSWLDGGPTSVDNGVLLCEPDHDWVHTYDITIVEGPDGALTFIGRDGRNYGTSYPRGPTTLFAS